MKKIDFKNNFRALKMVRTFLLIQVSSLLY